MNPKLKFNIFLYGLTLCVTLCGCEKKQDTARAGIQPSDSATTVRNKSLEKQLFEAIENYDDAKVKKLIELGVNVDAESDEGIMMGDGHYPKSAVDFVGWKVFEGMLGSCTLSATECMNSCDEYDKKYKNILWMLIDAGASLDGEENPVRNIVKSGNLPFVQLLLKKGVDLKKHDKILHSAAIGGNTDVFKIVLKFDNDAYSHSGWDNRTVLMNAVSNEEIVKIVLDMGVDINGKDANGRTAFTYAVREGNEAVVKLLINRGADIHTKGSKNLGEFAGENALMQAVLGGHKNIVKLLLDLGFDINEKDANGRTALDWAAGGVGRGWRNVANPDMVRFLLKNGAGGDSMNKGLMIISHISYGCTYFSVDTVRALVQFGADVSVKDNFKGMTAKDCLEKMLECDSGLLGHGNLRAREALNYPNKVVHLEYAPRFKKLTKPIQYNCRCCHYMDKNDATDSHHPIETTRKIFRIDDNVSIYYPQFFGFQNKMAQDRINEKLKTSFTKTWQVRQSVCAGKNTKQYYSCDFDAWRVCDRIIIIMKKEFTIVDGEKVGEDKQKSYFIDMRSGKFYKPKDLFKKGFVNTIARLVCNINESSKECMHDNFFDYENFPFKNNFILTHEGLEIYLDRKSAARYGKRVFKIKYTDLDGMLDKDSEFYKAFAGTVAKV